MSIVYIELQRVQSWLFEVPRLRAMVGANALLGRVLREDLRALAQERTNWTLQPITKIDTAASKADPLSQYDDPQADAQLGILSRDGGHFEAEFATKADAFVKAAAQLLHRELPGIRFRISVDHQPRTTEVTALSNELPVFETCEWTGHGIGSEHIEQGEDRPFVSQSAARRQETARQAECWQAQDLASLLSAKTSLKNCTAPQTFEDLAQSGYLALIHADGNGVGKAAGQDRASRAQFFHRNRVLLRQSLKAAIDQVCLGTGMAPLRLLMLGGDDVLVVCQARIAMKFVVALCEELCRLQSKGTGTTEEFLLTLGVGVVITKPTIPFHRLHDTAEQLAASAKRRFRGFDSDKPRSVVDWAVYTTSWLDDPEEVRRRDWVRPSGGKTRILSQRPVDVLGKGWDSLQGLVNAASKLSAAPRSQLRYLIDQLPLGQTLSELAFAELSPQAKSALKEVCIEKPWIESGTHLLTSLLDLVEVYEIDRLGAPAPQMQQRGEVANAQS